MSKSTGNVYYVSDLLGRGFSGEHLRFHLIYGHYREKLNFTFEKLAETSRRLDSFKSMVVDLQEAKPTSQAEKQETFTSKIVPNFESNMDNDLDVKAAFDSLYETIRGLHKMRDSLSVKDVSGIMSNLHRIDYVLQCIF
jgi:cysteinyl-tRNA synthetase